MTRQSLDEILAQASPAVRAANAHLLGPAGDLPVQTGGAGALPEPERPARRRLSKKVSDEARRPRKCLVRVTRFGVRLYDTDNVVAKYHVDALRYAGVLLGDAYAETAIEVGQVKVQAKAQERTEIAIDWL